jgi:hypothetical protein
MINGDFMGFNEIWWWLMVIYPLVIWYIAIEAMAPFIVDLPTKNDDFRVRKVQMFTGE